MEKTANSKIALLAQPAYLGAAHQVMLSTFENCVSKLLPVSCQRVPSQRLGKAELCRPRVLSNKMPKRSRKTLLGEHAHKPTDASATASELTDGKIGELLLLKGFRKP